MAISLIQHKKLITQKVIAVFDEITQIKSGFAGLFPRETTPTRDVSMEVRRNNKLIAVDIMRFASATATKRTKHTEKIYTPPYFKLDTNFSADQVYDMTFGSSLNPNAKQIGMMTKETVKSMKENREMVERNIQKQHADVLQTGIVTLTEGDSVDYQRKAASIVDVGAAEYWTAAAANPFKALEDGMTFLRDVGNSNGSTANVFMRREPFNALMANAKFKEQADFRKIDRLNVDMPKMDNASGMAFQGQVAAGDFTLNIWTYNQGYQLTEGGAMNYYLSGDLFVMVPDDFQAKTVFGAIPALNSGGMPYAKETEYYSRAYTDQRTMSRYFEISSAPLVMPITVDKIYTAKVLA